MAENKNKYVSPSKLSLFLDNLKDIFSPLTHTHKINDISDYTVDTALSSASTNPVQNKVLNAEFDAISDAMGALEAAIDDKVDASHNHDDRYYTETEIDTKLDDKADTTHNHDASYDAKGASANALTEAKIYADNAAAQKSQVQIIIWGADD